MHMHMHTHMHMHMHMHVHVHMHMHAPVFPWIGAGAQKTVSCRLALANKKADSSRLALASSTYSQ